MNREDVERLIGLLQRALREELGPMYPMSEEEVQRRKAESGDFDMLIGDFGITNIRKRSFSKLIETLYEPFP